MPIRLTRALARVLPALILLVAGLVAALFTGRRTPRPSVPASAVPAPVVSTGRVPGLRRWGPAFVFASLLLGGGGILALLSDDEGESPVTVLSQPERPPETSQAAAGSPGRDSAGPTVVPVPRAASDSPPPRDRAPDASQVRETPSQASRGTRTDPAVTAERPPTADPAGAAPDATRILGIAARPGGRLSVTARAAAGSSVRLYLNEALVAPARIGRDGHVTFVIGGGVRPGAYEVRLDRVDAASGAVRSRVEVPFLVPDANGAGATETARASSEAAHASPMPEADPATVFVSEVRTARIVPGDSLWAISRKTYGEGDRYTAIFDANQDQIRDPDLIYPGQVFVLPSEGLPNEEAGGAGGNGTPDRGASN